jgi:hypothetical protein
MLVGVSRVFRQQVLCGRRFAQNGPETLDQMHGIDGSCRMAARGVVSMEESSHEGEDKERPCQAVSPRNAVCGFPATVRCLICESGFVTRTPRTNGGTPGYRKHGY